MAPPCTSAADEFDAVREYILKCPHVPPSSPAIRAALEGLDREVQRRIRDEKLRRKFGSPSGGDGVGVGGGDAPAGRARAHLAGAMDDPDVVVVETGVAAAAAAAGRPGASPPTGTGSSRDAPEDEDDDEIMEWQDVPEQPTGGGYGDPGNGPAGSGGGAGEGETSSFLGRQLCKVSIDAIALNQVRVRSPTAAIAVALHAALRSAVLGFACTGVPEDESASRMGGFAPPVRELPKNIFLPLDWEKFPNNISVRYRKNGTGALVLNVMSSGEPGEATGDVAMVHVKLVAANSKEPPSQVLSFPLSDHINLDSWNAAVKAGGANPNPRIAPSLHYKALSSMLTKFCRTFDLGAVADASSTSGGETVEVPYVDNTVVGAGASAPFRSSTANGPNNPSGQSGFGIDPLNVGGSSRTGAHPDLRQGGIPEVAWKEGRVPSTLDQAFPNPRGPMHPLGGDFADDLLPAGWQDPRFLSGGHGGGRMGGNLMGPNHPMFAGRGGFGGMDDGPLHLGGPGTMQPRFDPVYPPGLDGEMGGPRNRNNNNKPSRTGEPNPDHLVPPNSLGGGESRGMFS